MKRGQMINLIGKSAYYVRKYEGKKNLIFYSSIDTIQSSRDNHDLIPEEKTFATAIDTILTLKNTAVVVPTIKIIAFDEMRWVIIEKLK